MKRTIFSEIRTFYETTVDNPHTFRVTIKMKDIIEPKVLEHAVDLTLKRYPYFLMEVEIGENEIFLHENTRHLPLLKRDEPTKLGSAKLNGHLLSISWWKNKIHLDVYHAITDGGGIYPLIKTLLYYYCSGFYGVELFSENVRLADDPIPEEEWIDPAMKPIETSPAFRFQKWNKPGFQIFSDNKVTITKTGIVYNIRIPETEFMKFNLSHDGSPGTIISLFMARAIAKLNPNRQDPVVIAMCVNQRKALNAPLAHQSLVGDVRLVYDEKVAGLPFIDQATSFRGMVSLQSDPDMVREEIKEYQQIIKKLEELPTHAKRHQYCVDRMNKLTSYFTATLSYVGKADMGEAEQFIQEFHVLPSTALPSSATPLTIELSAMNGSFYVNFMQYFEEECYMRAFINELRENGINYDVLYQERIKYPAMVDMWSE